MLSDRLIDEACAAHEKALAAQQALVDAASERDAAVRQALRGGAGAQELASALGVTRQRIYTMAKGS